MKNGCRDNVTLLELILEEIRKRVNNVIVLDEYSR